MKIVTDSRELIGEEIAIIYADKHKDEIAIGTKQGSLLIFGREYNYEYDETELTVLYPRAVFSLLQSDRHLFETLRFNKVLSEDYIKEYEQEKNRQKKELQEKLKAEKEKRDWETYLELKKKYEGENGNEKI